MRPYQTYCVKMRAWFWLRLVACKGVFPLCYFDTRSTSANYLYSSDTKGPVLVVMECKRVSVIYVYELVFLLRTSKYRKQSVDIISHKIHWHMHRFFMYEFMITMNRIVQNMLKKWLQKKSTWQWSWCLG